MTGRVPTCACEECEAVTSMLALGPRRCDMTPADLRHACRHLYRYADACPVCTSVEVATDGTSWDRLYRTPGITPWYRTSDGELTWPAVLVILAVTGAAVLVALVVGQRWQDQRCAASNACSYDPSSTDRQREAS